MASLDDLPAELLLNIFYRLSDHQVSLAILARSARRYRAIAQEVLYHSPVISDATEDTSPVLLFLRTAHQRRDLARFVRRMVLPSIKRYSMHSTGCKPPRCICGLEKLKSDLARSVAQNEKSIWPDPLDDTFHESTSHIPCGFEPAFSGALLSLLPNLEKLDIRTYERPRSAWEEATRLRPRITQTLFKDYFSRNRASPDISAIAGLRGLKHISFEDMMDWDFLRAGTLESVDVRLDLSNFQPDPLKTPQPPIISTTVTRVTLYISVNVLELLTCVRTEYLETLLQGLPALRRLRVCLTEPYNRKTLSRSAMEPFEFDSLVLCLRNVAPVEELSIELDGTLPSLGVSVPVQPLRKFLPILDKVERVNLPNEALADPETGIYQDPYETLPRNIRTIEITNPTTKVVAWAERLLQNKRSGWFAMLSKLSFHKTVSAGQDTVRYEDGAETWLQMENEGLEVIWRM